MRSEALKIVVEGLPVAQPRHTFGAPPWGKRNRRHGAYIPEDHPIHAYKLAINLTARRAVANYREEHKRPWDMSGPFRIDLLFLFTRLDPMSYNLRPHIKRPDRDNLEKSVCDALKGIVWNDDCQAIDGRTVKAHAVHPEDEQTVILVTRYDYDDIEDFVRSTLHDVLPAKTSAENPARPSSPTTGHSGRRRLR